MPRNLVTFLQLGRYGRIGNQLFEVASTIGIAARNSMDAKFPPWFCNYTKKNMSAFFENPVDQAFDNRPVDVYTEPAFTYSDVTLKNNTNLYNSYLQSERYFLDCAELIRHHFAPAKSVLDKLYMNYGSVLCHETCSIHVRRGDYVGNSTHDVCGPDYYNRAIEFIRSKTGATKFLVFSDDMSWCKSNFPSDFVFVENGLSNAGDLIHRINNSDIEELFLMSLCKHNIIANSSFSWWGSWLNCNPDKVVVSPSRWFGTGTPSDKDVYAKYMIKI
jgi:hypothetical protein